MRFGSVCSGIEAASVAFKPLGWEAAWFSEIEKFPRAVLAHHYPETPNYGDMTELPERILSGEIEAPDMLCGGTPCQAFSVAGNRQSLQDARGNLSLTFCEIADAIDAVRYVRGDKPAIIFYENVPGILNTPDNAFGCFLGKLAGESCALQPPGGRWTDAGIVHGPKRSIAWRILDAQYFGLAQRRRRVFLCATQRYTGAICPSEILFEQTGERRDTPPSRKTRETVAGNVAVSTFDRQSSGEYGIEPVASTMAARDYKSATDLVCYKIGIDVACTLRADGGGGIVPSSVAYTPPHVFKVRGGCEGGGKGYLGQDEQAFTVSCGQDQMLAYGIQGSMIGRNDNAGPQGDGIGEEISFTQNCADRHAVAYPINTMVAQGRPSDNGRMGLGIGTEFEPCSTITSAHHHAVATNMIVRRLTPTECEILQGFPVGYTNIPWRGKQQSPDGPRYKALGNSWATTCVSWIGKRINEVH